eukprot:2277204-Rhodomonas_salina.1
MSLRACSPAGSPSPNSLATSLRLNRPSSAQGGEYGESVGAQAPAVEEANVIDAPQVDSVCDLCHGISEMCHGMPGSDMTGRLQDPITSNSLYIPAREGRFTCGFLGRTLNGVDRFHSFEPT